MDHELHAVPGCGEADSLRRGGQQGEPDAERHAPGRDPLPDRGPNEGQETDDDSDEDDRAEGDLGRRQLIRVPDPGHDGRHRRRHGLLHEGRERRAKSRQGSEERETADAEADRARAHEEERLAAQALAEGEGPDSKDDDRDRQSNHVGAHEADELDGAARDDGRDAGEEGRDQRTEHGCAPGTAYSRDEAVMAAGVSARTAIELGPIVPVESLGLWTLARPVTSGRL